MKNRAPYILFPLWILAVYFLIKGAIMAASFLIPLSFAVIVSLVCVPIARMLERKNLSRGFASLICVALGLTVYLSFFWLIAVQGYNISEKWPEMKGKITPKLEKTAVIIEEKSGINVYDQLPGFITNRDTKDDGDQNSEKDEASDEQWEFSQSFAPKVVMNLFGFLGNSMLTFVYVFFLLTYRNKLKRSILHFFSADKKGSVEKVLTQATSLALNFLAGRLLLIFFLALIYSIGLLIAGVENAILISFIAAILSLIPYLGVIIGFVLAISLTFLDGGDTASLIIVASTYSIAQFIESYILEPYIVGDKVNLNPLMTILVVVMGGMVWGVSGMILSILLAAILKICFDASENLKPLGYMLGDEDAKDDNESHPLGRLGRKLWNKIKGS
ncbi:AI-2E family transporter [Belliella marina]|uniref:AI-2E family transporter n=1 Tax=Belliella marina TaxID=1644146 RepID=A0ABW4VNG3_9BACT